MSAFRLPCNRLTVADTDAIIALVRKGVATATIRRRLMRPGLVLTAPEIEQVRREHIEDENRARAAS